MNSWDMGTESRRRTDYSGLYEAEYADCSDYSWYVYCSYCDEDSNKNFHIDHCFPAAVVRTAVMPNGRSNFASMMPYSLNPKSYEPYTLLHGFSFRYAGPRVMVQKKARCVS